MFREITRFRQALSAEECREILIQTKRGVLSVNGDDGFPYCMPINHYYCSEDGKIYFHSGIGGHREDALKKDGKVSFCVYDGGYQNEGEWALNIKSVIVFGSIEILDDRDRIADITAKLSYKFTSDAAYIQNEIKNHAHRTRLLVLTPEHISGKAVQES